MVEAGLPSRRVVAEYRSDGTTRTGRPYKNAYVSIFELRDDRITLIREYFDPNVVVEALRPA